MGEPIDPDVYLAGNPLGGVVDKELESEASLKAGGETSQIQPTRGRDGTGGNLQDAAIAAIQERHKQSEPWTKAVGSRVDTNVDSPHHHQGMGRSGGAAGTKNWRG